MYSRFMRVRSAAGDFTLINAREPDTLPDSIRAMELNLDDGMVLVMGDAVYQGADALHRLALMGGRSGLMNRLHGWLFRSPTRSRWLYPLFQAIRNSLLLILGRQRM